jgi:L-cystine transport system permease protein
MDEKRWVPLAFNVDNFYDCFISGLKYLHITAELAAFSFVVGSILGLIVAVIRNYKIPVISQILALFVTIYQGIPVIVAMLIYTILFNMCFDNFMKFLHINLTVADVDFIVIGYFALTLQTLCDTTETFRSALKSIPINQYEAAYSVGLTKLQTLHRIILPQLVSVAIPNLMNNIVGVIKSTSLVSAVGITELIGGSLIPSGITYSFVEGYTAAGLIYWGFSIVVLFFAGELEKKYRSFRKVKAI